MRTVAVLLPVLGSVLLSPLAGAAPAAGADAAAGARPPVYLEVPPGPAAVLDGRTFSLAGIPLRLAGLAPPVRAADDSYGGGLLLITLSVYGGAHCVGVGADAGGAVQVRCLLPDGQDLGALMVMSGGAAAAGSDYAFEESVARDAGVGLWKSSGRR
jgi:endonuclease YncB( thermonuclease family)